MGGKGREGRLAVGREFLLDECLVHRDGIGVSTLQHGNPIRAVNVLHRRITMV